MNGLLVILGWALTAIAAAMSLSARRARPSVVTFGPTGDVTRDERRLMFATYLAQQRLAFALAAIAVAAGVLLGAALIGRALAVRMLDVATLSTVVGVAGDISIGVRAFRLYERASKRLEKLVG